MQLGPLSVSTLHHPTIVSLLLAMLQAPILMTEQNHTGGGCLLGERIEEKSVNVSVKENCALGTEVCVLSRIAYPDRVPRTGWKYRFGRNSSLFQVDPISGSITTRAELDAEALCELTRMDDTSLLKDLRMKDERRNSYSGKTNSNEIMDQISCSSDGQLSVNLHVNLLKNEVNLCLVYRVFIIIEDVDDNVPVFPTQTWHKLLKEMLYREGRRLSIPEAKDADLREEHRRIIYHLSAPDNTPFRLISTTTGQPELLVTRDLDAEEQKSYNLLLVAFSPTDHWVSTTLWNISDLEARLEVCIEIEDMNDNEPWFAEASYNVSVEEDTPVGKRIFQMTAHDADESAKLVYSMGLYEQSQAVSTTFAVESDGTVRLLSPLDYELCHMYCILIHVSDGEFSAQTKLFVSVLDTNDEAPVFDLNPTKLIIEECTPVGKRIGQVRIHDADSEKVNGQILCWEPGNRIRRQALSFQPDLQIDPGAGTYDLLTNMIIDRESITTSNEIGQLPVYLICSDGNMLTDSVRHTTTMTILLFVEDINDQAPVFTKPVYHVSLVENNSIGQEIVQIKAKDADDGQNAKLTYSILDTANFKVDSLTGWITANIVFDRESRDSYQVTLVAMDQGNPPLSSTALLNLTILGAKHRTPKLLRRLEPNEAEDIIPLGTRRLLETNIFTVRENAPPDTYIGDVVESRERLQTSGSVQFELLEDTSSQSTRFRLLPNGSLYTAVTLDREEREEYTLDVRVSSQLFIGSIISTGSIIIRVLDENDNGPEFIHPPGLLPTNITPIHLTAPKNTPEFVSTEHGAANILYDQPFVGTDVTIRNDKIQIRTSSVHNSTVNSSTEKSQNELKASITVPMQEKPGHVITTLKAVDKDNDNNGRVSYDIMEIIDPSDQSKNVISSDPLLAVDAYSGEIVLRRQPTQEELGTHYFRVGATDNGDGNANTEFKILVLQFTNAPPDESTQSKQRFTFSAQEKPAKGTGVVRLDSKIIIAAYSVTLSVVLFIVITIVMIAIRRLARRRPQWNMPRKKPELYRSERTLTTEEKDSYLFTPSSNLQLHQRYCLLTSEGTVSLTDKPYSSNISDVANTYGCTCTKNNDVARSDSSKNNDTFYEQLQLAFEPLLANGVHPLNISSFSSNETEDVNKNTAFTIDINGPVEPFNTMRIANVTTVNLLEAVEPHKVNVTVCELHGCPS